ncbi:SAM-dependent methyltransferase [Staphylococcus xylosus]|uniref:SAM-dependent methyltransferase n=1 Tax=Staphylococcus xylosus TaxID=1288 RepID=A0A418IMP9_STAXY|nr:methyltransferase domain-containing protein [Staphylococcus xylosus]RIN10104.1 SAM-dependent methyltransferase [Staphylococcus xylosus]
MNQWDEKFDSEEYIYGKEANSFVKGIFKKPTDNNEKILLLAEGEGRNAVYLAKLRYDITTYDMSQVGINKQYQLAKAAHVDINANYGDITKPNLAAGSSFDYSINIFGHVPNEGKQEMFNNLVQSLVIGGYSYFEFYSKEQLAYGTGGPKDESMLYTIDEIEAYLKHLPVKIHELEQHEVYRNEGIKHTGTGSIIQGYIEKI